jgi:uncharacterized Tic20 family protein
MDTTRSLVVVAVTTLVHLAWWAVVGTSAEQLASDPWSLVGAGLFALLVLALTPVFFLALSLDAGHVRESASAWTPDRRLWVGGGIAVWAGAFYLLHTNVVWCLGVAYLVQRLRHPTPVTVGDVVGDGDPVDPGDRSLAGVAVHLLALPTSALGAGLVYATAGDDFTRANARHALNWHLPVLVLTLSGRVLVAMSADSGSGVLYEAVGSVIPQPVNTLTFFLGLLLVLAAVAVWAVTAAFAVVAAIKAGRGSPWSYPFAFDVVSRDA